MYCADPRQPPEKGARDDLLRRPHPPAGGSFRTLRQTGTTSGEEEGREAVATRGGLTNEVASQVRCPARVPRPPSMPRLPPAREEEVLADRHLVTTSGEESSDGGGALRAVRLSPRTLLSPQIPALARPARPHSL